MKKISLLDCTLRDGGYINNWNFGFEVIRAILQKLNISNVEYVECGYLSEKKGENENYTQYRSFDAIKKVLPDNNTKQHFAVMIDHGQYDINHITYATEDSPIIRVCFHKKDADEALSYCSKLIGKGYTVFVQPMASINYTDIEFVELIKKANELNPACFYLVDSFGVIEIEDFQRILALADHNLKSNIILGYHAHNNLQQAYGNAKYMIEQNLLHDIILDASVYGMGRGAGNLNMELFASYLNKNYDKSYNIDAFLDIMDLYLKPIFAEHFWGYSLPFYLSAQYNCHPNYAGYFSDKNTLSNKSMRQLLASLPDDVKIRYSPEEAEKYYQAFQEKFVDDTESLKELKHKCFNRKILVIAPGKSISTYKNEILKFITDEDPIVIAINTTPSDINPDYIFCSNEKRINEILQKNYKKLILTSNIKTLPDDDKYLLVNYSSYIGKANEIADNPALMVFRLLHNLEIQSVYAAGLDGYSMNPRDNYFNEALSLGTSMSVKIHKNELIKEEITKIKALIDIILLTPSKYIELKH